MDSGTTTEDSGDAERERLSGTAAQDSGTGFDAAAFTCMPGSASGCATGQTCCLTQSGVVVHHDGVDLQHGDRVELHQHRRVHGRSDLLRRAQRYERQLGVPGISVLGQRPGALQPLQPVPRPGQVSAGPLVLFGVTVPDVEACQAAPADAGPGTDSGGEDSGTADASDASGD